MKKVNRKVSQSIKTNRKIDAAVREATQAQALRYAKVANEKTTRYEQQIEQLKQSFVMGVPASTPQSDCSVFVANWQSGWKWFSNLALAAIVAINTTPIPPEILDTMPPDLRQQVTIGLAVVGILGRFVNQSRKKDAADV